MLKDLYTFDELKFSSQLVRDLINENPRLEPLVNEFFDLSKIEQLIEQKEFAPEIREDLYSAIKTQYEGVEISENVSKNIEALSRSNTYTITTGHQLNLVSGPLYTIYKVLQVISITQELNDRFAEHQFVPLFWMATEDHDFEEINHLNMYNDKIEWVKGGQENVITGRLSLDTIERFLEQIESKFQDPEALSVVKDLIGAYRSEDNLSSATRSFYNSLFGKFGLVIIDGDDPKLKKHFARAMQREVEEAFGIEAVEKNNEYLEKNGYHQQVYVRACNMFYITNEGKRERVISENGAFWIADKTYAPEELSEMIIDQPEHFSPNALFRPLYQETILPNLVYVGGGGEMAYWMQLSELFSLAEIPMPMLRVRDSVLLYRDKQKALMDEMDISLMDLRIGVDHLVKDIAINNAEAELKLEDVENDLAEAKKKVMDKVNKVNPAMESMVEAEFTKMVKSLERIESKLIKAEKQKHEKTQNQLVRLRDSFFPNDGFQERHENFLMYITKNEAFIQNILANLKPEKTPFIRTIQI